MKAIFDRPIDRTWSYNLTDYEKGEMLPLVSDTMFEVMFNNESRKKYVSFFLAKLLEKDFKEVFNNLKFEKEKLDKENYYDKGKVVDLVCSIDEKVYNIEMNNNTTKERLERNIDYMGRLYGSLKRSDKYNYNDVLQVNINNFNFKGNKEEIQKVFLMTEEGEVLTNKIKIINIYLPLIKRKLYNKSELTDVEKLLMIANEKDSKDLENIMEGNKLMEEYRSDAYDSSQEEEILGLYDKEKEDEWLRKAEVYGAREDGIKQGIEQTKIENAKNLIKKGVDLKIISEAIGLDIEQLEKLKKEN